MKLHRIWFLKGWGQVDSVVGRNAAGIGDINDDGFDDFSVSVGHEAWVFLGGGSPSTMPVYRLDSAVFGSIHSPVVGNFLGDSSRMMIGFIRSLCPEGVGACFIRVLFYFEDPDSVLKWSNYEWNLGEQPVSFSMHAADLDRDGDDELIIINDPDGLNARVRIYRGGEEFSLQEPTLTITSQYGKHLSVIDFDGDDYRDLAIGAGGQVRRLSFWWGSETTPWSWADAPDRYMPFSIDDIGPSSYVAPWRTDFNGDGISEMSHNRYWADSSVFFLWLSNPSQDPRTRPYDSSDVDLILEDYFGGGTLGSVADSLRRYDMLALTDPPFEARDLYGLGGGADGPNLTYDVWMSGAEAPLYGGISVGDINNDGWEDRIMSSGDYGGPGVGIAAIFAGGPYIPSDDPTVDVREISTGEHVAAIHTWPNPVDEELHIAWRGDLTRHPHRFLIRDVAGRSIADVPLYYWTGQSTWKRTDAPPGSYFLTLLDINGYPLANTTLILR